MLGSEPRLLGFPALRLGFVESGMEMPHHQNRLRHSCASPVCNAPFWCHHLHLAARMSVFVGRRNEIYKP